MVERAGSTIKKLDEPILIAQEWERKTGATVSYNVWETAAGRGPRSSKHYRTRKILERGPTLSTGSEVREAETIAAAKQFLGPAGKLCKSHDLATAYVLNFG